MVLVLKQAPPVKPLTSKMLTIATCYTPAQHNVTHKKVVIGQDTSLTTAEPINDRLRVTGICMQDIVTPSALWCCLVAVNMRCQPEPRHTDVSTLVLCLPESVQLGGPALHQVYTDYGLSLPQLNVSGKISCKNLESS